MRKERSALISLEADGGGREEEEEEEDEFDNLATEEES